MVSPGVGFGCVPSYRMYLTILRDKFLPSSVYHGVPVSVVYAIADGASFLYRAKRVSTARILIKIV